MESLLWNLCCGIFFLWNFFEEAFVVEPFVVGSFVVESFLWNLCRGIRIVESSL